MKRKDFIQAALTEDDKALTERFADTLTVCIGFAVLTADITTEALDALVDAHPDAKGGLVDAHGWKLVRRLMGNGTTDSGLLHRLLVNVRQFAADNKDACFWLDFGNDVHSRVEPALQRLGFALANSLGRSKRIASGDSMLFARLIVAQSIASLAAEEVARAKREFSRHTIMMNNQRTPVPLLFESLSCAAVNKYVRELNISLIEDRVPDGFDIFDYAPAKTGVTAVANLLHDSRTWNSAIERSVELNPNSVKK